MGLSFLVVAKLNLYTKEKYALIKHVLNQVVR